MSWNYCAFVIRLTGLISLPKLAYWFWRWGFFYHIIHLLFQESDDLKLAWNTHVHWETNLFQGKAYSKKQNMTGFVFLMSRVIKLKSIAKMHGDEFVFNFALKLITFGCLGIGNLQMLFWRKQVMKRYFHCEYRDRQMFFIQWLARGLFDSTSFRTKLEKNIFKCPV